jgi:hypothetical protein
MVINTLSNHNRPLSFRTGTQSLRLASMRPIETINKHPVRL